MNHVISKLQSSGDYKKVVRYFLARSLNIIFFEERSKLKIVFRIKYCDFENVNWSLPQRYGIFIWFEGWYRFIYPRDISWQNIFFGPYDLVDFENSGTYESESRLVTVSLKWD